MTITHPLYDNPYGPTQPVCAECREPLPWPETEGDAYPSGYVCQECEEGIQRDRDADEAWDAIHAHVALMCADPMVSGGERGQQWARLGELLNAWRLISG